MNGFLLGIQIAAGVLALFLLLKSVAMLLILLSRLFETPGQRLARLFREYGDALTRKR